MNQMQLIVGVAATCIVGASAIAQPVEWLDPIDGSWLDPARWSSGVVPGANDDVLIAAGDGTYSIGDVSGTVRSLQLQSQVSLTATGVAINESLDSLGSSAQTIRGDWIVGGYFGIGTASQLSVGFGSTVAATGMLQNDGTAWFSGNSSSGQPTTVSFGRGAQNNGLLTLFSGGFPGVDPVSLRVNVTGDFVNSGLLRSEGTEQLSVLEVFDGRLINQSGGVIGSTTSIGYLSRVHASLENHGRALINDLGASGSSHDNYGELVLVPELSLPLGGSTSRLRGDAMTNHVGAVLGDDSFATPQIVDIDGMGVSVVNHGRWKSGGAFSSFAQSETGELLLDLLPPVVNAPEGFTGESIRLSGAASLDGRLTVEFSEPLFHQGFLGEYELLTASAISGAFSDVSVLGLPEGLSGGLVYTDTSVSLVVVPAPGSVCVVAVAAASGLFRRRRAEDV